MTELNTCSHCGPAPKPAEAGATVIALVGAQNSGKSTLFNALTGARVHTGNWPGTSVAVSRGAWGRGRELIDFPGTYSLNPLSPDEALTRTLLVDAPPDERPDVVIVAVDATALGRSLYLVTQALELDHRVVVALTKTDVARAQGEEVHAQALAEQLGVPVVVVNGRTRQGLRELEDVLSAHQHHHPRHFDEEERFAFIDAAATSATSTVEGARTNWTERIDRIALHPVLGPIAFLAVMWLVFQITIYLAAPLQGWAEWLLTGPTADAARAGLAFLGIDHWLVTGLVVDGLISGVGMVASFLPLMALMFLCMAVLEDSGYMARAAVVTDRVMRSIGLPGKAFIPIVIGFGCNVPAISATRTLSSPRQRILTSLLIPFTSCSARLVVFLMLGTVFFPDHAGTVVFTMYVISIALVVLTGLVLRRTLWRTMPSEPLLIDLPTYQWPTPRLAATVVWVRVRGFLKDAATIIVATVIVVWLMLSIPVGGATVAPGEAPAPAESAYGAVSHAIAPVFEPAGFGSWSLTGPLLTGFVAKEAVISTWAQTYAVDDVTDEAPEEQAASPLAREVTRDFDEASGGHALAAVWAYMLFMLCYTPCVATIAAQKREIGWRWTLFGFGVQLAFAWLLATGAFQLLKLVGL